MSGGDASCLSFLVGEAVVWQAPLTSVLPCPWLQPALLGASIVVPDYGHLKVIAGATGKISDRIDMPSSWAPTAPPAVAGQAVFLPGNDGGVRCFQLQQARLVEKWWSDCGKLPGLARPQVCRKLLFFGSGGGVKSRLWAIDVDTGEALWSVVAESRRSTFANRALPFGASVIMPVGRDRHSIQCRNSSTGELIWLCDIDSRVSSREGLVYDLDGSVALDDQNVYALSTLGLLTAVDATSGILNWSFQLQGPTESDPICLDSWIIAVTQLGNVVALDASSGELVDSIDVTATVRASPVILGPCSFGIATVDGAFHCFELVP